MHLKCRLSNGGHFARGGGGGGGEANSLCIVDCWRTVTSWVLVHIVSDNGLSLIQHQGISLIRPNLLSSQHLGTYFKKIFL